MFIGTHFPNMLRNLQVDGTIAAMSLSLIGAFNIVGTFAGVLQVANTDKIPVMLALQSSITRKMVAFIMLPPTTINVVVFSAGMGLLWLGTVPLTGSIVARVFGLRYMGMLFGFCFCSTSIRKFHRDLCGRLLL